MAEKHKVAVIIPLLDEIALNHDKVFIVFCCANLYSKGFTKIIGLTTTIT